MNDSAGNPPAASSATPGVLKRKLRVPRNSSVAIALPAADADGAAKGRTAIQRRAARSSIVPSTADNVLLAEHGVQSSS